MYDKLKMDFKIFSSYFRARIFREIDDVKHFKKIYSINI